MFYAERAGRRPPADRLDSVGTERPPAVTVLGSPPNPLFPELTRRFDGAPVLGYLNFSDGRPDPRFRKALADVFAFLLDAGDRAPWKTVFDWLTARAEELERSGSAASATCRRRRRFCPPPSATCRPRTASTTPTCSRTNPMKRSSTPSSWRAAARRC
jgi:hypothetical protein